MNFPLKKTLLVLGFLAFLSPNIIFADQVPKYVFVFIGDGMGLAQVQLAQAFAGSKSNYFQQSLLFSTFPAQGFSKTQAYDRFVTDSAAGGTAIACGMKANNGQLSIDPANQNKMTSLASLAKKQGMKVGIVTTDSIVGATPAAFYANQPGRNYSYPIAYDLLQSDFDFFYSVTDFYDKNGHHLPSAYIHTYTNTMADAIKKITVPSNDFQVSWQSIPAMIKKSDYTFINNAKDFFGISNKDQKYLSVFHIPLAVEAQTNSVTLADITAKSIEVLDSKKGFFLMVESSYIDKSGHANDAAMCAKEVIDLDHAVAKAYEFYLKHPKDTLIIITADHETGALELGTKGSNFGLLENQKGSIYAFEPLLKKYIKKHSEKKFWSRLFKLNSKPAPKFEEFKPTLVDFFNFGDQEGQVQLSQKEWDYLEQAFYDSAFLGYLSRDEHRIYGPHYPLVDAALAIIGKKSGAAWGSFDHSGIAVPIFAIGQGAENFNGFMENTELSQNIAKIAFPESKFPELTSYPYTPIKN